MEYDFRSSYGTSQCGKEFLHSAFAEPAGYFRLGEEVIASNVFPARRERKSFIAVTHQQQIKPWKASR